MKRSLLVASIVTTLLTAAAACLVARRQHDSVEIVSSASGAIASTSARTRSHSRAGSLVTPRDASEIQRRLRQAEPGTYIGEVLLTRDSALSRWHEHLLDHPLRVWIQPNTGIRDWDESFVQQVRGAFLTWSATGIPIHFRFVSDSAHADAHVVFIDHFSDAISGKTRWARDDGWWIVDADVTLAVHHDGGETLDSAAVRAIALHEVGHLLGLDHTSDIANIMTPRVRVRELSNADRSTMKLLYTLPPGPVR